MDNYFCRSWWPDSGIFIAFNVRFGFPFSVALYSLVVLSYKLGFCVFKFLFTVYSLLNWLLSVWVLWRASTVCALEISSIFSWHPVFFQAFYALLQAFYGRFAKKRAPLARWVFSNKNSSEFNNLVEKE